MSNHHKPISTIEEAHDLGVLCCEFAPWNETNQDGFDGPAASGLDKKFILATGGNDDCVKLWTITTGQGYQI